MTTEEFVKKVEELDKIQGNYYGTSSRTDKQKEQRKRRISQYPQNAIDFFEWAINNGERVFIYEDIIIPKNPRNTMSHFVFPDYDMCVRFNTFNGKFEKSSALWRYLKYLRKFGFIFFIRREDNLEQIIAYFNKVKGYYLKSPRIGLPQDIVKPIKKKRERIKVLKNEKVL